jgi:hypothetical protein
MRVARIREAEDAAELFRGQVTNVSNLEFWWLGGREPRTRRKQEQRT